MSLKNIIDEAGVLPWEGDEFESFELDAEPAACRLATNSSAEPPVQKLPVDKELIDAMRQFQRTNREAIIGLGSRPKAAPGYTQGQLKKQMV